jgi:transcriptional regulator with XRE-family HTH domain
MTEIELGKIMSKNIEKRLIMRGISKSELARIMGSTKQMAWKKLKNIKTGSITLKSICKIANALEVEPVELLEEMKLELKRKGE